MGKPTRPYIVIGGILVAAALAIVAWFAVSIGSTASQARDLQAQVSAARASVAALDTAAAATDLATVAQSATALREDTQGFAWGLSESLPLIGDTARATTAFATAADQLAQAALPLVTALEGAESTTAKVMEVLGAPAEVATLRDAAEAASADLAGFTPDGLRFGLDEAMREAQEGLPSLVSTLDSFTAAAGPLSSMLGRDGPTTWLVMSQNPAELRGTGGLFNAYLIVTLDKGTLTILEAGSRKQLDKQFPRASQIPYWDAVDPGTAATWGPVLGEWASFNIPADFPTVARLASAGMAQRGTPVDGVVAIDPSIIAAILAGTGPVEHKGVNLDSTNAVGFFTKAIYEDFPGFADVAAKDELAMGLTYATIDAATKRPLDTGSLIPALTEAIEGDHLKAWSSVEADQAWLMGTPVAGSLDQNPDEMVVGFANGTGGKLDPYVTREVIVDSSTCAVDKRVTVTIRMQNDAPEGLPEYVDVTLDQDGIPDPSVPSGFTRTFVTVYAPGTMAEGDWSGIKTATRDGASVETSFGGTGDRPIWTIPVELARGEATELVLSFTVPRCPLSDEPQG